VSFSRNRSHAASAASETVPVLLFFSINGESKAETDLLC
jgi:hypothetical protein